VKLLERIAEGTTTYHDARRVVALLLLAVSVGLLLGMALGWLVAGGR